MSMKKLYVILLNDIHKDKGEKILLSKLPKGRYKVRFSDKNFSYTFSQPKSKEEIETIIEMHGYDKKYFITKLNNRKLDIEKFNENKRNLGII